MTTESTDELYRLLAPIFELNEALPDPSHRWTTPKILEWGESSGYLLWARQQPQPISHKSVQQWLGEHKPERDAELRKTEAKLRELEGLIHAKEKELEEVRQMENSPSRFFLALDCGPISVEEIRSYLTSLSPLSAPSYQRAKTVWQAIYNQVMGNGGYISTRTTVHSEHAYVAAYGDKVPQAIQLQIFRIMDRFRQEWQTSFVQFSEEGIDMFFAARKEGSQTAPVAYSVSAHDIGALHESHVPRVHRAEEETTPPVPIDPPFESIPLYREKQPQERKVKKSRPFLERYYTSRRLLLESTLAALHREGRSTRSAVLTEQAIMLAAQRSRKYLLTNSALRMIATLQDNTIGTSIKQLPETHIFIELVSPIDVGIYEPVYGMIFQSLSLTLQGLNEQVKSTIPPFDPLRKRAEQTWMLTLLDEGGDSIMTIAYEQSYHAWRLAELHNCPDHACTPLASPQEMIDKEMFTNWRACPKCETFARYWSRWFPIALLAIAGEFAEEAEPVEREVTEMITRKEKRPDSKKYDEHTEEVRFRIVTFDASVKRRTETEPVEPHEIGPSWLDLAVEQGTVVYVKRGFGKSVRNLDPARNARWKYKREVPVRAYEKRVPMTVANLQRVITKVVASKYE